MPESALDHDEPRQATGPDGDATPAAPLWRAPEPTDTGTSEYLRPSRSASAARAGVGPGDRRLRVRRAISEFLLLPALVVLAYVGLAAVVIVVDRAQPEWAEPARHALESLITQKSGTTLLSATATSVVTVTSITFSVLLLAVQQSAASLTPVVFDQFLRRRGNQLYLGMFVGLSVYAFVVLLAVGSKPAPVFGATIALVLTVVAFLALVVLIYSTVDQMRPTSVVQAIHDRALAARRRELRDLRRTRRVSERDAPVRVTVHAEQDGYVTLIDLDEIVAALPDGPASEVTLLVTVGDHVAVGDALAIVKDDEEARARQAADGLRDALQLDRERDLDSDASFAVSEIANISWTAFSSAKQNPQAGRDGLDRLRDLVARWSAEAREHGDEVAEDVLPIVYDDRDLDTLLDVMLTLLGSAAEARQHDSAAYVVAALADAVRIVPERSLAGFVGPLARTLRVAERLPLSRPLDRALERLARELRTRECHAAAAAAEDLRAAPAAAPPARS